MDITSLCIYIYMVLYILFPKGIDIYLYAICFFQDTAWISRSDKLVIPSLGI